LFTRLRVYEFMCLQAGNQTATVIALCSLTDLNLHLEACNELLRENGAMEVFVSLLDVKDVRCKVGSGIIYFTLINYCV